ncbi:hypothetical protein ACS5UA_17350 [Brucella sp. RRSP16]|uniref:hypothetical protein n=1 Tax=Brucella sp. RRSP16 TaxID=3453707 RepID=UPI003FCECE5F
MSRKPGGSGLAALVCLAVPLIIYIFLYLVPIGSIISLSLDNRELSGSLVNFSNADSKDRNAQAAALVADMRSMDSSQQAAVARELNQELSGFRTLFLKTARAVDTIEPDLTGLTGFDPRWNEEKYWAVIAQNSDRISFRHFERATGFKVNEEGRLTTGGDDIYLQIMWRTLAIAIQVTLVTLLISYP